MFYSKIFEDALAQENAPAWIQHFHKQYEETFYPFFQKQGEEVSFCGRDGFPLVGRRFVHPTPKGHLLLLTGYNESCLKYAELIYQLYGEGYSVYTYDHRGQGFSGRYPKQKKRGYISSFPLLVDDLQIAYEMFAAQACAPLFLFAHSMGGAVSLRALQTQRVSPRAVVLSAPLVGIFLTPWPVVNYLLYLLCTGISCLGLGKSYAFGQKDCIPLLPFDTNDVTHSQARFRIWRQHIFDHDALQLGGPTFRWIHEIMNATQQLQREQIPATTPVLLLQAEEDTVVDNTAQDRLVHLNPGIEVARFPHARHEIFMECDFIRNKAWDAMKSFLERPIQTTL